MCMDDLVAEAYACENYSRSHSFSGGGWLRLAIFEDPLMKQKKDWMQARAALRAEADQAFPIQPLAGVLTKPAEAMLHELLVHKFELEMQIEELKRTYAELEEARDRYLEYFDGTPIGHLTVDREGGIEEINLTGAALLGIERGARDGQRLAHFVSTRDQDRWHRVFLGMVESPEIEQLGVVLEMARPDHATFDAYLDCRRIQPADGVPTVRVTLFDIGMIRQAEADRKIASAASGTH